jgi:hypothetical protein
MSCGIHMYEDCNRDGNCQRRYERASSYCGNCWKLVTNAVFLGKNSPHITGKCRERFEIPKAALERTSLKKSWPLASFQHSSDIAAELNRNAGYPKKHWSDVAETSTETHARLIELLEEQNRLLRQLAA